MIKDSEDTRERGHTKLHLSKRLLNAIFRGLVAVGLGHTFRRWVEMEAVRKADRVEVTDYSLMKTSPLSSPD